MENSGSYQKNHQILNSTDYGMLRLIRICADGGAVNVYNIIKGLNISEAEAHQSLSDLQAAGKIRIFYKGSIKQAEVIDGKQVKTKG